MPRESKLTEKDMSVVREADVTRTQRDKRHGTLRDYSLKHTVEMRWDLNKDAIRDQIFELKIDNVTVLLDAEEVQRLIRWV